MEDLDYWRLCEELSIVQAVMLIIGEDPSVSEWVEEWDLDKRPTGYEAVKSAISTALKTYQTYDKEYQQFQVDVLNSQLKKDEPNYSEKVEQLEALSKRSIACEIFPVLELDINGNTLGPIEGSIDLINSKLYVNSLKQWLRFKGINTGFFFPEPTTTLDFLDSQNPRYAPKLAAAVTAWQNVTNTGNRSPKQALDKWLREHASEYGLANEDGKHIDQAIEECSKVANWKPGGGATKTPT